MAFSHNDQYYLVPNGLDGPWVAELFEDAEIPFSFADTDSPVFLAEFLGSVLVQPGSLLRADSGLHPIVPDDLLSGDGNGDFLDMPSDVPSAEEHQRYYWGVLKYLGPEEERTAVVRTLGGCDVVCSTKGCEGLALLHESQLVQIAYHLSGEDEGKTFVTHRSEGCTPTPSNAASRVGSRAPSRAPSRAGSRPPQPGEG